jgi:hypothetical protein
MLRACSNSCSGRSTSSSDISLKYMPRKFDGSLAGWAFCGSAGASPSSSSARASSSAAFSNSATSSGPASARSAPASAIATSSRFSSAGASASIAGMRSSSGAGRGSGRGVTLLCASTAREIARRGLMMGGAPRFTVRRTSENDFLVAFFSIANLGSSMPS